MPVAATAPTVPPTVATTPAVVPTLAEEVEAAYLRAWRVYAEAVGRQDASRLPRAFAASALALKRHEVADLRRRGLAIRVDVRHHLAVALLDGRTAVVTDFVGNHMVLIDARTRRPVEPDPDDVLARAYTLRLLGGTWKVTEAVALG